MPKQLNAPRLIQNPTLAREEITFSHPSEQELAQVLDFYGIEWRYEPSTFPLRWDEEGNVLEAFSPDFYLVDQDLYVELTTLRPKLMRIKNRKIRRLKDLYPTVNVRLWTRRDFLRLLERFGLQDKRAELVGSSALGERHAEAQ